MTTHPSDRHLARRRALQLGVGLGAAGLLAACAGSEEGTTTTTSGTDADGSPTSSSTTTAALTTAAPTTDTTAGTPTTVSCAGPIPQETAGPYPADGTNGPNVLRQEGIVRRDIRASTGSDTTSAEGVPLNVELVLVDAASCEVLPGAAVYLWHCDRDGAYSVYSRGLESSDYLRGVQVADSSGVLRFTSIFPGAYSGRWPHIHFEVFDQLDSATDGRNAQVTSQLALPESTCEQVYAASGYEISARNMPRTTLSSDLVFSDGVDLQMATVSGSNAEGYLARLVVGV